MAEALGQQLANVCTCAITSCRLFFSSFAAKSKSIFSTLDSISLICSSVTGRPNSYMHIIIREQKLIIICIHLLCLCEVEP